MNMRARRVVVLLSLVAFCLPVEARSAVWPDPYISTREPDPVIEAAGDISCAASPTTSTCHAMNTSDILMTTSPTAILALGDNQYDQGSYPAYSTYFDPTWGRVKSKIRPVPGNHEYMTSGAAGYYEYFGSTAGDPSRGYYSYDLGSWHIVALNSSIADGATSSQVTWLEQDLAAHPTLCTLAYWHHPRWSSGEHGNITSVSAFWRVLYSYHVDVVLNGHDHDYERFARQTPTGTASSSGIREFVVGTGGKSHYVFQLVQPNSQVRNSDTFGVLQMTLHSSSYSWRFIPEAGKTFTDSGTTSCT
jgi:acid phosphatase type 7